MKDYVFDIVGLRISLRTPNEITVSENLRPFLTAPQKQADCTILLQPCDLLPAFSESGFWHGPDYHDTFDGASRIFHCSAPEGKPVAVTQLFENGNIEILVLPEYLSYFSGTAGIFNRIGMETLLLQHKGLLLHASLIRYQDKAIAFAGPSGVGKSTQADIWHTCLGAEILNGDRAALRSTPEGWIAYGSPYAGTSGIYKNENAPLSAILFLRQAGENRLWQLTPAEAFVWIYPELSIHNWDKAFVAKATDLSLQLLDEIPVYCLECRPEESAALLVKKGLGL